MKTATRGKLRPASLARPAPQSPRAPSHDGNPAPPHPFDSPPDTSNSPPRTAASPPRAHDPAHRAPESRHRVLAAATAEFALRGFEGATVDRIAARARLNKAMIYYHFNSKRALYTCVLRDVFAAMGDRLSAIAASDAEPAAKMDRFVSTFVLEGQTLSHIAPIMLREIAEGGRRLDEETYTVMIRVVRAVTQIVEDGRAAGQFEAVDPFLLYLTTIWPIVVYLATAPIRSAVARIAHVDIHRLDPDRFIRHMQMLNRRALMPATAGAGSIGEPS